MCSRVLLKIRNACLSTHQYLYQSRVMANRYSQEKYFQFTNEYVVKYCNTKSQ